MSTEAMSWVIRRSPYTGAKYALHLMIADSANDAHDFELWARQRFFADKARISRTTANRLIAELIAEGMLVELENHADQGRPNRYRFLMPDVPVVFETRTQAGGVAKEDTPKESPDRKQGVARDDRGVSPETTGGVTAGDRGVSREATHNPIGNPTDPTQEPNARAPLDPEPPSSVLSEPTARVFHEDPETTTLFSSGADAPAAPPSSAAPPPSLDGRAGPAGWDHPTFPAFWDPYPKHADRAAAFKAYEAALRKGVTHQQLVEAVDRWRAAWEADGTPKRFIKGAASWITMGRWAEDPAEHLGQRPSDGAPRPRSSPPTAEDGLAVNRKMFAALRGERRAVDVGEVPHTPHRASGF